MDSSTGRARSVPTLKSLSTKEGEVRTTPQISSVEGRNLVEHAAEVGVVRLPIQPYVRIRRRRMRVVLPVLPPEVAPIAIGVAVFRLETLLTGPPLEQRAVHGDLLVGH